MTFRINTNPPQEKTSPFANLRLPREEGMFIAESEKVVVQLLESELEISSLYLTQEHFNEQQSRIEAHEQPGDAEILIAPKSEMESIVGYSLHQGILASAKIPKEQTLEELIVTSPKPQLYVILDEIADAENMGALYRTALALGVTAIIIDSRSTSPWLRRALRVSIGAAFHLPTITAPSLADAARFLKAQNIQVYAATLGKNSKPIWECDLRGDVAIIFGSEGHGIRKEVIEVSSGEVIIPMSNEVDSLNVGVAQGMVLYEAARQRS
ncbi:MAG TPA: RNA methyltransferase [Candidatus Kapabacteria bacterium]